MKSWKHTPLVVLAILTILSLLLSACGPIDNSHGNSNNARNKDKNKDKVKQNETESETDGSANVITICRRTGSAKHPYVVITVSNNAAKHGHAKHQGDIIPAPKGGCPKTVIATDTP